MINIVFVRAQSMASLVVCSNRATEYQWTTINENPLLETMIMTMMKKAT